MGNADKIVKVLRQFLCVTLPRGCHEIVRRQWLCKNALDCKRKTVVNSSVLIVSQQSFVPAVLSAGYARQLSTWNPCQNTFTIYATSVTWSNAKISKKLQAAFFQLQLASSSFRSRSLTATVGSIPGQNICSLWKYIVLKRRVYSYQMAHTTLGPNCFIFFYIYVYSTLNSSC